MKNAISEMKNTAEGIKSRIDEAKDQIRGQGRKKFPDRASKQKKTQKEQKGFKGAAGKHEL